MRITRTHYAVGSILCGGITTILSSIVHEPSVLLILLIISIAVSIFLTVGRLQDMDKYGEDPRMKKGTS